MGQFWANLLKLRCFLGCWRISFTLGLYPLFFNKLFALCAALVIIYLYIFNDWKLNPAIFCGISKSIFYVNYYRRVWFENMYSPLYKDHNLKCVTPYQIYLNPFMYYQRLIKFLKGWYNTISCLIMY